MFGFMKKVKEFFVGKPNTDLLFPESYKPKDYAPTYITPEAPIAEPNQVLAADGYSTQWVNPTTEAPKAEVVQETVQEAVAAVEETPKKKRTVKPKAKTKKAKLPLKKV